MKRINDDQQNEEQNDASAKKKRRRSNLQRGKRRSIAETVLIKNLQKERENEGATAKSEAKKEAICGEKQEDANATHESQQQNEDERQTEIGRQKDGDELQKSADTATNVQVYTWFLKHINMTRTLHIIIRMLEPFLVKL